jgi:phage shock protein PspC (stress-responsive transcriptional regulator)
MNRSGKHSTLPARPETGRLIAGVCVALGAHFSLDVTLVRLAFVLLGLAWGLGLILYGILWVLMPGPEGISANRFGGAFQRTARGMRLDLGHSTKWFSKSWHRTGKELWSEPHSRRWMAIGLITAGAAVFFASIGAFDWLSPTRAFGLAIVALGVSLIVVTRGNG